MHPYPFAWFLVRLAVGTLLGLAIGIRTRISRPAGRIAYRGLVAAGAAAFAAIGPATGERVIANIVTGVGFLAGGVIFRQGATVTGINSAATIWATAAVGALAGVGLFREAAAAAAAILSVNVVMEPIAKLTRERIQRRRGQD